MVTKNQPVVVLHHTGDSPVGNPSDIQRNRHHITGLCCDADSVFAFSAVYDVQ